MPDHHNEHDQQDPENHDDCDDCKRQRTQNQKFIAIYQKLQQVDKRTSDIKGSIIIHQQQVQKNQEVINFINQKVEHAKNIKNEQDMSQFQQFGYHLYAETISNSKKSSAQKQNQRLKAMLKKIYEEKSNNVKRLQPIYCENPKTYRETIHGLPPLQLKESTQWFQKGNQSSRTQSRKTNSSQQNSLMDKSFQIFSTKSSFNMTKRKTFQKKDFEELNLWLFEQRNEILEKELYEAKPKLSNDNENRQNKISQNTTSLNKGVERYINIAKNTLRVGNSQALKSLSRRQTSFMNKEMKDSLNSSIFSQSQSKTQSKVSGIKAIQPEQIVSNSNKILNRRAYKGIVLPTISSK